MTRNLKNTFPVCFLSNSTLLLFKNSSFYILDLTDRKISRLARFNTSISEAVFTRIPIISRILRKGIRCGIKVSEDLTVFVSGKKIYEININTGKISDGYITPDKSRPLVLSKIESIKGFDDGIYFGGYKGNPNKHPISIFKRINRDDWIEVFTFPLGSIEHIHNLIPDPYKNVVYIFTGDFNHSAGIWKAENGFAVVSPILIGDQKYRSCVGFPTPEGLIYATDSPFIQNSIRLLRNPDGKWESKKLMTINGPSIYGCNWGDDFVFSTSVEGDSRNQNPWAKTFQRVRGKGVIENFSFIYKGNLKNGFKAVYKIEKDLLPFYLFQFGVLQFPSGFNESMFLPVYHMATKKHGMDTILLEINQLLNLKK